MLFGFALANGVKELSSPGLFLPRPQDDGEPRTIKDHHGQPFGVGGVLIASEAVKEADDFHGRNVILAARIAGQVQGGQILASSLLKELTESAGDVQFAEEKEAELKELACVHRVCQVLWR